MSKPIILLFVWMCLIASCKCNSTDETSTANRSMDTVNSNAPVVTSDNNMNGNPDSAMNANAGANTANATNSEGELFKKSGSAHTRYKSSKTPGEFPEGSDKILTEDDVKYLSEWGLKVMKNEIYARHGQTFPNDPDLDAHFRMVGWYHGANPNVSKRLTRVERENIVFLNNYKYKPGIE